MKNKALISYVPWIAIVILVIISFCKEDIYGNITTSLTIGNYLNVFKMDNLKIIGMSFLFAFTAIMLLIVILFPLVMDIIKMRRKKQNIVLLLVSLPLIVNNMFVNYLLRDMGNEYARWLLNITITFAPIVIIVYYFVLREVDFQTLNAAKDLGEKTIVSFKKLLWPSIRKKFVMATSFLIFMAFNILIFDFNSHEFSLGNLIYNYVNYHVHIPFVCAIAVLEYLMFRLINRRQK